MHSLNVLSKCTFHPTSSLLGSVAFQCKETHTNSTSKKSAPLHLPPERGRERESMAIYCEIGTHTRSSHQKSRSVSGVYIAVASEIQEQGHSSTRSNVFFSSFWYKTRLSARDLRRENDFHVKSVPFVLSLLKISTSNQNLSVKRPFSLHGSL